MSAEGRAVKRYGRQGGRWAEPADPDNDAKIEAFRAARAAEAELAAQRGDQGELFPS